MSNDAKNKDTLPKIGYADSYEPISTSSRSKSTAFGTASEEVKPLKTNELFSASQGSTAARKNTRSFVERDKTPSELTPSRADLTETLQDVARLLLEDADAAVFDVGLALTINTLTVEDIPSLSERYRHAQTPESRAMVIETIGTIKSQYTLPILLEAATTDDEGVRDTAYAALDVLCSAASYRSGPFSAPNPFADLSGVMSALAGFAMDTAHDDAQRTVALGLLAHKVTVDFEHDFDTLHTMTTHAESRVRGCALLLLHTLVNVPIRQTSYGQEKRLSASTQTRLREVLTRLIQDPVPEVCVLALQCAADMVSSGGELDGALEDVVLRALQAVDAPVGVRGAALEVVHALHLAEHLPLLIARLRDPHPKIRAYAAYVVGLYTEPEAEQALFPLLNDDDLNVRLVVLGALAHGVIRGEGIQTTLEQALESLVEHPSAQVRAFVAAHPYASNRLIDILIMDADMNVRLSAVNAETDIPRLIEVLRHDPDESVRKAAVARMNMQIRYAQAPAEGLFHPMREVLLQQVSADLRVKVLPFVERGITRESALFPEYLDLVLMLILKDVAPEVQLAAYDQLTKNRLLTPQETVTLALHLLETADEQSPLIPLLASTLTTYITHDAALEALIDLTQHTNRDVRRLAADKIAESDATILDMPRVIPALVSGLGLSNMPPKLFQSLMMRALAGRITEPDLAALRDLLRTAPDNDVRMAAGAVLAYAADLTCWREVVALKPDVNILGEGKSNAFEVVEHILNQPNPVPELLPLTEFDPRNGHQLLTAIVAAVTLVTLGERETAAATLARALQAEDIRSDVVLDWPLLNLLARMGIPQAMDAAVDAFVWRLLKADGTPKAILATPNANFTQDRETLFAWMDAALGQAAQAAYLKLLTQPAPPAPSAASNAPASGFGRPGFGAPSSKKAPDIRIDALKRLHGVDDAVLLPLLRSVLKGTERSQFQGLGRPMTTVIEPPSPALVQAITDLLTYQPTPQRAAFLLEMPDGALTSSAADNLGVWALLSAPDLTPLAPYLQFDPNARQSVDNAFTVMQMMMFAGEWRYLPQYFTVFQHLIAQGELTDDSLTVLAVHIREVEALLADAQAADVLLARLPSLDALREGALFDDISEQDSITLLLTLATLAYLQEARVLPYVEALLQSSDFTSDSEARFFLNALKQSPHPDARALYEAHYARLTQADAESAPPDDTPAPMPEPANEALTVFKARLADVTQRTMTYHAPPAAPEPQGESQGVSIPEALQAIQAQKQYVRSRGRTRAELQG